MVYILLLFVYCIDMITMEKSNNTKDKLPYTVAMIIVGVIGFFYLKYGNNIQLAERIFNMLGIKGGM